MTGTFIITASGHLIEVVRLNEKAVDLKIANTGILLDEEEKLHLAKLLMGSLHTIETGDTVTTIYKSKRTNDFEFVVESIHDEAGSLLVYGKYGGFHHSLIKLKKKKEV
jgi:hypothetical protein